MLNANEPSLLGSLLRPLREGRTTGRGATPRPPTTAELIEQLAESLQKQLEDLRELVRHESAEVASKVERLDGVEEQVVALRSMVEGMHTRMSKLRRDLGRPWTLAQCEPEQEFIDLARLVHDHGTTGLGDERLYVLWQAAKNVRHLVGAAVEVGTYRGGSAYFIAAALTQFGQPDSELRVIDTFHGHPADRVTARDSFHPPGKFSDTSFERVREYLSPFPGVRVRRGEFLKASKSLPDVSYRLVHVDTDLYRPTLDCLKYFGARMVSGGIIVVDDYGAEKCVPVVDAVANYLAIDDRWAVWDVMSEQIVLVRL
jgi:hypothetical protein